jgi:hypothetical protein
MTYSTIKDTGYTSWPRVYYKCPVCGIMCRRIGKHTRDYHTEGIEH